MWLNLTLRESPGPGIQVASEGHSDWFKGSTRCTQCTILFVTLCTFSCVWHIIVQILLPSIITVQPTDLEVLCILNEQIESTIPVLFFLRKCIDFMQIKCTGKKNVIFWCVEHVGSMYSCSQFSNKFFIYWIAFNQVGCYGLRCYIFSFLQIIHLLLHVHLIYIHAFPLCHYVYFCSIPCRYSCVFAQPVQVYQY